MGLRSAKRLAASRASQQQPQQLQMKATCSRTFSPNWTRLRPRDCLQQVHALRDVHLPGDAVLDEGAGGAVEGHADVQGVAAGLVQVLHLVPAVARPHAYVGGGADHFGGPFVVHHLEGRSGAQGALVHEDPPHAGLARDRGGPSRNPPRRSGTGSRAPPAASGRTRCPRASWRTRRIRPWAAEARRTAPPQARGPAAFPGKPGSPESPGPRPPAASSSGQRRPP